MENQYRKQMNLASKIMKQADKCAWKLGLEGESQIEGGLLRCANDCDGNNYNCSNYYSIRKLRKKDRLPHRDE